MERRYAPARALGNHMAGRPARGRRPQDAVIVDPAEPGSSEVTAVDAKGASSVAELVGSAAQWRLLARLLERPAADWWREISALAPEARSEDLRRAAKAARIAAEGEYLALFGPGGTHSPREVAYAGFGDPGQLLADIRGFYSAFAFVPRIDEPDDHVAVEANFVAFLRLKEAYLRAALNAEAAGRVLAAREEFVGSHLARLGQGLAERVPLTDPPRYLAIALQWLGEQVGHVVVTSGTPRLNVV